MDELIFEEERCNDYYEWIYKQDKENKMNYEEHKLSTRSKICLSKFDEFSNDKGK